MGYKNKQDYIDYHNSYRKENRALIRKKHTLFRKLNPWMESFYKLRQRCNNKNCKDYHNYGGRNISCHITKEEVKKLWFRDKAYAMRCPTIDRKNNNRNYELGNCQFIENYINAKKDKKIMKIGQFDKGGKLIKIWNGQNYLSKETGYDQGWISKCIKHNKLGYGYNWRLL